MSLNPQSFDRIPKGNVYMRMRDEFGRLYSDGVVAA